MKTSLLLSLVILAAGALLGWKRHGDLAAVRVIHAQVAEEARALGLEPEKLTAAGKPPLPSKSRRRDAADKIAEARTFAREMIDVALELKKIEGSGAPPDEGMQRRIMETLARFMDLDSAQIKTVIAELRNSSELDDKMRRDIVGFSILMLANDQPEAALAIFAETSDMEGMGRMDGGVISTALGKWAERDPLGALEWLRGNAGKHADLITEDTKAAVIAGAAKLDPGLALSLMDEAGLEETRRANALMQGVRGGEERSALLAALRADKKHSGLLNPVLSSLGRQLVDEGFESGQAWLSSAGLSESETVLIAEGLSSSYTRADTGRWIGWMADNLPADRLAPKVEQMMAHWIREDYRAAGEWINGAPEGPAKRAAVKSYAETVAPYEPAAAAQWALTLPAGRERENLLRNIHDEWKKRDKAAAGDFARKQGIGE